MKILVILFLFSFLSLFAQQISINGIVEDSESHLPLPNANIYFSTELGKGTITNFDGEFTLSANVSKNDFLIISYVGYETQKINIQNLSEIPSTENSNDETFNNFYLKRKIIPSQTVLVEASVGKKGITPLAFDQIKKKEIQKDYTTYDVPKYLSNLPSTTFYSEGGNGIGYNYLSIRGFDQRRISVSINGIPQNDPEDNNVYWLDFPDLLASTELIQVQRGAGSGVFGYPAIGGSINLITSSFTDKPKLELSASYGSYITKKYSASFSSGLINQKYAVYGKLSKIRSSGYKDKTWVDFGSYFLSAIRYDKNFTTQFNFFGGPVADGLGYTGIAKFAVKDKNLRRENYSDWGADENGYTYVVPRKADEIENFSQPHYELLNEWQINENLKFNSALFLVTGNGFFDYDGSWAIPDFGYDDYFRLKENGFIPDSANGPTNALIRAQVENTQYGWIPRFSLEHKNGVLFFGGELRKHRSLHWGAINYAENLPTGVTKDYHYYSYRGGKDIISAFVNESYNLSDQFNLFGELQLAYHNYLLFDEEYIGTDFSVNNLFVNPRIGINYKPIEELNIYFSFASVSREPRLTEYYDAAESSGGELPQFKTNSDGSYNFNEPLVKPETMNDFELGTSLYGEKYSFSLNLFYMVFNDEIVKDGQVDRFGQPTTGNVDRTVHLGAEFSAIINLLNDRIELFGNTTVSKNTIEDGKFFIDENNSIGLSGNRITGFPDFLANFGIAYNDMGFYLKLTGKYVGKFYSDNYDDNLESYLQQFPGFVDYYDNVNDSYFVFVFFMSYEFNLFETTAPWKVFVQVNNLFDNLYSANAIGKEFFPAAERNWLAGIQVGL
jgi:iron complex outermembrane recepter protein